MLSQNTPPCRLVEFYDEEYLENIVSLMHHSYTAVTFVYFTASNEPDRMTRNALRSFIQTRWGFSPDFLAVSRDSLDCAITELEQLTRLECCDFDITGGSSVFIAAAGALAGRFPERGIRLHEYDPVTGQCLFQYPKEDPHPVAASPLTIPEVMQLQKIQILDPAQPIRYDLQQDDLEGEILRLWSVVRKYLRPWNTLSILEAKMEGSHVRKWMDAHQWQSCKPLLQALEQSGILSLESVTNAQKVEISYQLHVPESALVLYEKGGNLLEMLTYLALNRSGGFSDCCTGVKLDWELEQDSATNNPFNEIDALGIRDNIPYFISCKNTQVKNEFFYEILTMTRHFGGQYAVPVVISTVLCNDAARTRAKEMGIVLLDNRASLSGEDFCRSLRETLCKN